MRFLRLRHRTIRISTHPKDQARANRLPRGRIAASCLIRPTVNASIEAQPAIGLVAELLAEPQQRFCYAREAEVGGRVLARQIEVPVARVREHLPRHAVEPTGAPDNVEPALVVGHVTTNFHVATSSELSVEVDYKATFLPMPTVPALRTGVTDPFVVASRLRVEEGGPERESVVPAVVGPVQVMSTPK